ncbi:PREDICTED: kalirin-like [Priapulus caudatus]|uniref:Kalirin-like n=1 Tax=Priapulus caudatus TaxID=37621 RepID=A0ABM1E1F4_PRICU|nr:PREDICTED: kalirin-like [Priapulus caudatus]
MASMTESIEDDPACMGGRSRDHRQNSVPSLSDGRSSPKAGRKKLFDVQELKRSLRPKSKTDSDVNTSTIVNTHSVPDLVHNAAEVSPARVKRHSATDCDFVNPNPAPTLAKVIGSYTAVKEDEITLSKGETVQVLTTSPYNMCLVYRAASSASPAAEGWVPAHALEFSDIAPRMKWHQSLVTPSQTKELSPVKENGRSQQSKRDSSPMCRANVKLLNPAFQNEAPAEVVAPLTNVTVHVRETATFECTIYGRPRPTVTWRSPCDQVVTAGLGVTASYSAEGLATLTISNCTKERSGEYTCIATNDLGSTHTSAVLSVLDKPSAPGTPAVVEQMGTSVKLKWQPSRNTGNTPITAYTVEYNEQGSGMWQAAVAFAPTTIQVVDYLTPNTVYQFRVSANNAVGISEPSEPSALVTIPAAAADGQDMHRPRVEWKTFFSKDHVEVNEIGRGRFSVVKQVVQKSSGVEMAAKFISKRLSSIEPAENEFTLLQGLQHLHLVPAVDTYETSCSYIITLRMVPGERLLDWLCQKPLYDEVQMKTYVRHLLEVVQYLHNCHIAHLDIKPENLLIDLSHTSPLLKLVDFGDARHICNNYYVHPLLGSPEFAAPELVLGQPVGLQTDMWSVGVVLYVLLSGVSPFLDDSVEETCSNIAHNDWSFPDQYFKNISDETKEIVSSLLCMDMAKRLTAQSCLEMAWFTRAAAGCSSPTSPIGRPLSTTRLQAFVERRKHQNDTKQISPVPASHVGITKSITF